MSINKLAFVREKILDIPGAIEKPKISWAVMYFFSRVFKSIKIIFTEPEILLFATLQWITIGLGYFLWVQIFDWLPAVSETTDSSPMVDIIFYVWSFAVVGIVALPIGILNACIGAVHFLHRLHQSSTIATCLRIVLPNTWSFWVLSWADSWITVKQILERLPKKEQGSASIWSEIRYYAWKLGISGMLPALLLGQGLIEAGKESVAFVKHKIHDVALLRVGYSLICWVVGIGTYLGAIVFFRLFYNVIFSDNVHSTMYTIYFWAGVPILVAVGFVSLCMRPIYVISCNDMYADYLQETNRSLTVIKPVSRVVNGIVVMLMLVAIVLSFLFFRDQLGITDMLSVSYM
jgi:hypothetical protein